MVAYKANLPPAVPAVHDRHKKENMHTKKWENNLNISL